MIAEELQAAEVEHGDAAPHVMCRNRRRGSFMVPSINVKTPSNMIIVKSAFAIKLITGHPCNRENSLNWMAALYSRSNYFCLFGLLV